MPAKDKPAVHGSSEALKNSAMSRERGTGETQDNALGERIRKDRESKDSALNPLEGNSDQSKPNLGQNEDEQSAEQHKGDEPSEQDKDEQNGDHDTGKETTTGNVLAANIESSIKTERGTESALR